MKISDFEDEDTKKYLKITDFENFFTVHTDKNERYFYNLNSTLSFAGSTDSLPTYTCTATSHWTLVSYQIYGTTRMAWLLMKLNNVSAADIFKPLQPGDKVKYLSREQAEAIVADLNDFDSESR